ncbi:MAG: LuxR C-terminal-related transcriptional regulator [Balneolaceae bacterium]
MKIRMDSKNFKKSESEPDIFGKTPDIEHFRVKYEEKFRSLSKREIQVLGLIAHDMKPVVISEILELTPRYVQRVEKAIRHKLSVENQMDYIKYALAFGLMKF